MARNDTREAESALPTCDWCGQRATLGDLGLKSWPKSTGGTGLHVVVPVTRRTGWEEAKAFTRGVAKHLARDDPSLFTPKMSRALRTGRIFVDYLRNTPGATTVADYSTRARPGAPVATPMSWEELEHVEQTPRFGVDEVIRRVASGRNPWPGFDTTRQSLTRARLQAVTGVSAASSRR